MEQKKKVCILFGGRSVEHEISILSARNVVSYIDRSLFEVILVGIDKGGRWFLMPDVNGEMDKGDPVYLMLNAVEPALYNVNAGERIDFDVVFPVLHGTDGEDGSVQGLFRTVNVPLVGTGVLGSALAMDKIVSKQVMREMGIPVAKFLTFSKAHFNDIHFERIVNSLGLPFMIKSAALGSSVGVSRVSKKEDFESALNEGFKFDNRIVAEEFISGREMECAVMGNEKPVAAGPGEVIIVKDEDYEFYDYKAKYLDRDAVRIEIPAKVDKSVAKEIRRQSIRAYKALHCEDFARVDLFLKENGDVIINEINSIPGFTDVSMFPVLWNKEGIPNDQLITKLIGMAVERWEKSNSVETSFAK